MSGFVFLEASELSVGETDGEILVPVVRTGDLSDPVTVTFGITGLDATPGEDFVAVNGTVVIPAGEDRAFISANILDDGLDEASETFVVSIINIDSGDLQAPRTARVTILDDETPVTEPPEPPLTPVYDIAEEVAVSGLTNPIDIQFLGEVPGAPDGSQWAYVAEKAGRIKLVDTASGEIVSEFIDLSDRVANDADRGMMDIVLHPNFPEDPYIYTFYVVDPPGTEGRPGNDGPNSPGNRFAHVVRLTADADNDYKTVVEGSAKIIAGGAGQFLTDISGNGAVDSTVDFNQPESGVDPETGEYIDDYIKVDSRSHAGGALAFGPDGALYISTGDGTSFNFADPRSVSVQDINSLSGKILRVDPETGLGLADNPFADEADSLSSNAAKVYQLGLRNPFSMAFDTNGNLLITETGWESYEEINSGGPGANFGWPYYEGGDNGVLLPAQGYSQFPEAAAFYAAVEAGDITIAAPIKAFSHDSSDPGYQVQSITGGGVIYTGDKYPALFQNDYFFADFSQGEVFTVDVNDRRDTSFLYNRPGEFGPVHFEQAPDGYVYYVDIVSGDIGRLLISGGPADELAPIATDDVAGTDPLTPAAPLNVLANDIDPDGSSANLIISAVASSAANVGVAVAGTNGGQFTIAADGTASFDPDGDFSGLTPGTATTTSVEYVTRDPDGREDVASYTVTVSAAPGTTLQINATGQTGEENISLLIDDQEVASFASISTAGQILEYTTAQTGITADRIKVAFTNDFLDSAQGIDRNVTIESVTVNGTRFDTSDPTVFSTGSWLPGDGITPGFGRGDVLHANGFFAYGQSPTAGSIITIDAAGSMGVENMELLIDGAVVATFDAVSTTQTTYTFKADAAVLADQVRVQFTNDAFDPDNGIDNNLFVDRITIDDKIFQTEDPSVFSTGTWLAGDGVQPGFGRGETLTNNGYFQYAETTPAGSTIQIFATGAEGAEIMELLIDGEVEARFEDISVAGDVFVFQSDQEITADQVRVAFVNDVFDPDNGIDHNLTVDRISIDSQTFQTEDPSVFASGVWVDGTGIQDGFGLGDTLVTNGFFQYTQLGADEFSDL